MKDLRRVIVALVIGSFSVAALIGILALLGSGDFTDTHGRVLLTTVIVGVESTVVLCLLALAGHRWWPLGFVGGVSSLIATSAAFGLTWGDFDWDSVVWEQLWKTFVINAIVAFTAAQFALLIALILRKGRESEGLGVLLAATGVAGALVAILAIGPILQESDPGGGYWRFFGILAILDVLGTVLLIALGAFGRVRDRFAEGSMPVPAQAPAVVANRAIEIRLSAEQQQRISQWALAHGTTPNRVVEDALDTYLVERSEPSASDR